MKFALTLLVIASLASLAVFGFLVMGDHHGSSAIHDCLAAAGLAVPGVCPSPANLSAFLEYHVGAFQYYSEAVMAVAFALSVLILFFGSSGVAESGNYFSPVLFRRLAIVSADSKKDLLRWRMIREKRDPSY
jgi:hypothetical protein